MNKKTLPPKFAYGSEVVYRNRTSKVTDIILEDDGTYTYELDGKKKIFEKFLKKAETEEENSEEEKEKNVRRKYQ